MCDSLLLYLSCQEVVDAEPFSVYKLGLLWRGVARLVGSQEPWYLNCPSEAIAPYSSRLLVGQLQHLYKPEVGPEKCIDV